MQEQSLDEIMKQMHKKSPSPNRGKESEKDTEAYLVERTEYYGGQSYKWSSPNNRGVPDRICMFPGNVIVLVEVKSEGETPTKLQQFVHRQLKLLVNHVQVVTTKAEVDNMFYCLFQEGTA